MNPPDEKKLKDLYDLIPKRSQARVADIGCGKGEMPIPAGRKERDQRRRCRQITILYRERLRERTVSTSHKRIFDFSRWTEPNYKPETAESQDLIMCIGASWIYGGTRRP
jgi:hypothetical protein